MKSARGVTSGQVFEQDLLADALADANALDPQPEHAEHDKGDQKASQKLSPLGLRWCQT